MPLIRTKALCERGHRLDGRHGPIIQTGPYQPTPPCVGTWHSSFPLYLSPKPGVQHSPKDLQILLPREGKKASFHCKFIEPKRNNYHHFNSRTSRAKGTSNQTPRLRTGGTIAEGNLSLAEMRGHTGYLSKQIYLLEDLLPEKFLWIEIMTALSHT